ncbi:copper chaperone PCu(A)C [Thiorhodococcus mannitoliphagus]|uniref:Copper chaperone PCu(A)C n=1 Tax=Thiorhodococcus mannitoliphagus TaxID=329406 RepID=A0A6P1DLY7_9GAMM|nr:copper chaperone PCu(A)C [Thiorhodococcus mannitoliphagus]NEX19267.1 copper chaperone PCu(A)C [Thiorhodococcus mannitoliphagus]
MLRMTALIATSLLAVGSFAASAADVSVADPYVRAVPPGQPNSAAFMALSNQTTEARALVAARSDAAEVVELHTHLMEDGMMRMRRVDEIALPAGETVQLKPGGLHIMLIGLKGALTPGEAVGLTLVFDDGDEQSLTAPVRKIDMSQMKQGH